MQASGEARRMRIQERIELLARVIESLAGALLGAVTVLIFVTALMRYAFAVAVPDGFDIARLLLGVTILWGLASASFRDSHIKVDFVWSALGRRTRFAMALFAESVVFGFIGVFAWMMLAAVQSAFDSDQVTFDLRLQVWPFYALAWLGVMGAALMVLARLILLLRSGRAPREEGTYD